MRGIQNENIIFRKKNRLLDLKKYDGQPVELISTSPRKIITEQKQNLQSVSALLLFFYLKISLKFSYDIQTSAIRHFMPYAYITR